MGDARHLAPAPASPQRSRTDATRRRRRRALRRRAGLGLTLVASLLGVVPLVTGDLAEAGSALEAGATRAAAGTSGAALAATTEPARVDDDLDGSVGRTTPWSYDAEEGGPRGLDGERADEGWPDEGWPDEGWPDEAGSDEEWAFDEDEAYGQDQAYGQDDRDLPDDPGDGRSSEPVGTLPAAPAPARGPGPVSPPEPTAPAGPGGRYPGADRFEAAALRALDEHPHGAPTVHLVVDGSPGAEAALAGAEDGVPVLLTTTGCLPAATAGAIEGLGARERVLLGPPDGVGAGALTTVCPEE